MGCAELFRSTQKYHWLCLLSTNQCSCLFLSLDIHKFGCTGTIATIKNVMVPLHLIANHHVNQ